MPRLNQTHKVFNVQGARKSVNDNGDTVVTSLGSLVRPDEGGIHSEFVGDDRPLLISQNFNQPQAIGGDEVYVLNVDDVYYRVHKFTTVGESSLGVTSNVSMEYLVVAGGGGGGSATSNRSAGGGGAGGLLSGTLNLSPLVYNIEVGEGGDIAGTSAGVPPIGFSGSNSSLFNLIALGGGGGRRNNNAGVAGSGGSGGGGGGGSTSSDGGSGTPGQGHDGGDGASGATGRGGGGGGAGGPGETPTGSATALGGVGLEIDITGEVVMYASGGRSFSSSGVRPPADDNTGDGGLGGFNGDGGPGGSGIVIVRYRITQAEYNAEI